MFRYERVVHLRDTDATGVLYFAQQLRLGLEVFEEFLQVCGLPLHELLKSKDYLIPIVHADADYFAPIFVGDTLAIELALQNLGTTSFTLKYRYFKGEREVGSATIIHVATAKSTWKAIPLPQDLLECLRKLRDECATASALPAVAEDTAPQGV